MPNAVTLPPAISLPDELGRALSVGSPLVVMVSLEGCPFCKVVRESYLAPMRQEQGLPVVQVDMRSQRSVRNFNGSSTTHEALITAWRIELAPTVLFLGRQGDEVALRLVVPGVQGVSWVKYLRRIELGDKPYGTKDEVIHYIDLMPDGTHRQYSGLQECKSVVTTPSGGQVLLDKGYNCITGLAWSGRGKVKRVDVSVDGGRNWRTARLESPVISKCLTRFNLDWVWDGTPAIIQSRAMDDTGYVQPTYQQARAVRGTRSIYHNNSIQSWLVQQNGEVRNVQVS